MNNKVYAILAVSLAALLLSPVFADVYVPPGPHDTAYGNQSEWISPTLACFTWANSKASSNPIGWYYTDGPTYNALTQTGMGQTTKEDPAVFTSTGISSSASALSGATTWIPYGTSVIIVGFIPGVTVAVDQVPPPVELQINWNGIPNTVTLSVPSSQVVGVSYPPTIYSNINSMPYQFAYPTSPKQYASYNLWAGNYLQVLQKLWGSSTAPAWWNNLWGTGNGEWFWYIFTPNAGDWIALDSNGQCRSPPTYDITALFEYGTSQIWFNHVAFNDCFLQIHKDVSWCGSQQINDVVTITNVGKVTATGLDLQQTFPDVTKLQLSPEWAGAQAIIYNSDGSIAAYQRYIDTTGGYAAVQVDYTFSAPFNSLAAGQTMVITLTIDVLDTGSGWSGTLVFDSLLSCTQIAPWKDPEALAALPYNGPSGSAVPLWDGLYLGPSTLFGEGGSHIDFDMITDIGGVSAVVTGPVAHTPVVIAMPSMTVDPSPVPLIAGETTVTAADVALVREAVVGLLPYDQRMDCNGNGRVDVSDLKAYEIAAGV